MYILLRFKEKKTIIIVMKTVLFKNLNNEWHLQYYISISFVQLSLL